jgi:endo-1,4-beta-xylanase
VGAGASSPLPNSTDPAYGSVLAQEYSFISPEYQSTFGALEPSQGIYNFAPLDALMDFARAHSMRVRGVALVWAGGEPSWLPHVPSAALPQVLHDHVYNVVKHYHDLYPDVVLSWEVVNEALTTGLGTWSKIGSVDDVLAIAYGAARQADPNLPLYYNDYYGELPNAQADKMLQLAIRLRQKGVPITGVGFQGHMNMLVPAGQVVDGAQVQANLQRFADAGLTIMITEFDWGIPVDGNGNAKNTGDLQRQAANYKAVLKACLAVSACQGFGTWGFTDKYSWIPGVLPGVGAALPFDVNYQKKPAYNAMAATLSESPTRSIAPGGPVEFAANDFDKNGSPDIVWQNDTTRQVGVWFMGGVAGLNMISVGFPTPNALPGWTLVSVHDMNGDGNPDFIWQNDDTRQVRIWYLGGANGLTILGTADPAPGNYPGWRLVGVADMDRNGVPDLVWQNDSTRAVGTWYMGGPQGLTLLSAFLQAPDVYPAWTIVGVADMDRDGIPDLVWQNDLTRAVRTWYMAGPLATTLKTVAFQAPENYAGWKVIAVTDMNADGIPDLVWQADASRQVGTWLMIGPLATSLRSVVFQVPNSYPGWRAVGPK